MRELVETLGASLLWSGVYLVIVAQVYQRLKKPDALLESWLIGYPIFYFFQVVIVKLLAWAALLNTLTLLGIYAIVFIAGALLFATKTKRYIEVFWAELCSRYRAGLIEKICLSCTVGIVFGLVVFSLITPLHIWDVQAYHLPMVASYIQQESLSLWPTQDLRQIYRVNGAELQMLNLALLSRSDAWLELPNILALVVSLGTVFGIARLVLKQDQLAALTVVVVLTAPQILYGGVTAKNDLVFLALILGAFYWVLRIRLDASTHRWEMIAVLAATTSLAVATKVMGLNVLGTTGLVLLFLVVRKRLSWQTLLLFSGFCLVFMLVLVGDVYWNNFTRTAVPVGIMPDEVQFKLDPGNFIAAAKYYLYDLALRRLVAVQIYEHDFGHYGYFFPVLLALGTFVVIRQLILKRQRNDSLLMLALLTAVLFISIIIVREPIQWDQRFMIWLVPVFAVFSAPLLKAWTPVARVALVAFCSAVCFINVANLFANESDGLFAKSALHLIEQGELPRLIEVPHEKYKFMSEGFDVLDGEAKGGDAVLYIGAEDTWMYLAWGKRFTRKVTGVRDVADARHKIASQQYCFIVIESWADEGVKRASHRAAEEAGYFRLFDGQERSIYKRLAASPEACT